jgi:hypothetical protein
MGLTYKAIDINLRCVVALKVINARLIGDESESKSCELAQKAVYNLAFSGRELSVGTKPEFVSLRVQKPADPELVFV